jgi:hypothetical protein
MPETPAAPKLAINCKEVPQFSKWQELQSHHAVLLL